MAQLLAVGIIALGLLIIASAIFIASREKKAQVLTTTVPESEVHTTTTTPEAQATPVSVPRQLEPVKTIAAGDGLSVPEENKPVLLLHREEQLPEWWHEQFDSLAAQLQYLREHAQDVERQIVILGEIATLVTELETLQRKHNVLPEGKISLFPLKVHRQPTDTSYTTDKRPAVRKYTIKAM